MFFEKLDYKVDIEALKKEVRESVFTLGDQVVQGEDYETPQYNGFGGWSILSADGTYQDGWETIQLVDGDTMESLLPNQEMVFKSYKYMNIAHGIEHRNQTDACVGEIKKVIDDLRDLGFEPCRARVTCLKAGSKSLVHKDSETSEYMARIHIPLWTNPKCVHICQGFNLHMPADGGVYILWTNLWHQIRNDSNEDRYHIIMDAYDTKKITKNFKYEGDFEMYKRYVFEKRQKIDAVELTENDILFFETIRENYIEKLKK